MEDKRVNALRGIRHCADDWAADRCGKERKPSACPRTRGNKRVDSNRKPPNHLVAQMPQPKRLLTSQALRVVDIILIGG